MPLPNPSPGDPILASHIAALVNGINAFDNASVTYDSIGRVATVVDTTNSVTYTLTWSGSKLDSYTDGTNTWTLTWTNNQVTAIAKT